MKLKNEFLVPRDLQHPKFHGHNFHHSTLQNRKELKDTSFVLTSAHGLNQSRTASVLVEQQRIT